MSDFKAKMHQIRFLLGGALPQTQLGELTALPTPRSWINGALLLREKEGKGERGEGGKRECFTSAGWDKLPWSHVVRWGNEVFFLLFCFAVYYVCCILRYCCHDSVK